MPFDLQESASSHWLAVSVRVDQARHFTLRYMYQFDVAFSHRSWYLDIDEGGMHLFLHDGSWPIYVYISETSWHSPDLWVGLAFGPPS